jgi:hypothetical protein
MSDARIIIDILRRQHQPRIAVIESNESICCLLFVAVFYGLLVGDQIGGSICGNDSPIVENDLIVSNPAGLIDVGTGHGAPAARS